MKRILLLMLIALSTNANAVLVCGNDTYSERALWYVGQSADDALGQVDTFGDVWCYATENELTYIKNSFTGLRIRNRASPALQWWQGDDAAFILNNL
jgi:hypothetical protein